MSKEAMKQALEAYCKTLHPLWNTRISRTEAEGFFEAGFKAAIAEAEKQEPVAWIFKANRELLWPHEIERKNSLELNEYVPLYFHTHPNREWVGLTNEEIATTADYFKDAYGFTQGVLWAEAKLKEKNT